MILFGHNSFVVKRINPGEVGLHEAEWHGTEIQLRQRYAHLYYIPVFPIGQVWVLHKNKKNYELSNALEEYLKNTYPHKVHWKAFSLFIAAAAIGLLLTITNWVGSIKHEKHVQEYIEEQNVSLNDDLDHISANNNYLVFEYADYYGDVLVCKVLEVKGDDAFVAFENYNEDYSEDYSISLPNKFRRYRQFKVNGIEDSVWISLQDVRASIKQNQNDKGAIVEGLSDIPLIFLRRIVIDDAYFIEKTNIEAQSVYYNEYVNYGADVIIDSIVPDNSSEEWKLSVERNIPFMHKFAIKTESENDATLYYHTLDGLQRTAIINKKGTVHSGDTEDYDYY